MDSGTMILIALAVIALIISSPLATIWALNTLFPMLSIPYSFVTWLAVIVLMLALGGFRYKS